MPAGQGNTRFGVLNIEVDLLIHRSPRCKGFLIRRRVRSDYKMQTHVVD